ncbi:hypothetical protein H5410_047975 [Solanum commersonii]|uniref:At1g61320/AtMIF1 LRR domain-containing protein n=1 Tax=Solanum commersonii TaxID=4109 RepID=A0A9J5XIG6_SOLCO|nr:hypothetical protein H5410_047975 [Solanum commersonii]
MRRTNGRKQFRTKFTQNHNERMLEFTWKLQKRDEELINEFCGKIRVEKWSFKVWLHRNNKKENTRRPTVDIFSKCLIHKILCFLSFKEATRMSIISKTWLQARSTLSNLKFRVEYSKCDLKIDHHSFFDNCREVLAFPLVDKWLDIALTNGVEDLDLYLTSHPLLILSILSVNSLRELVMQCCTILLVSLSSVVVNCSSLRKLSLSFVSLDENMLQTLLNSCPLIESFIFEYCWGLETSELVNLQKIKSVYLKVLEIRYCGGLWEIDAPNLVSLDYTWSQIPQLKIESRQLKHSKITLQCHGD